MECLRSSLIIEPIAFSQRAELHLTTPYQHTTRYFLIQILHAVEYQWRGCYACLYWLGRSFFPAISDSSLPEHPALQDFKHHNNNNVFYNFSW